MDSSQFFVGASSIIYPCPINWGTGMETRNRFYLLIILGMIYNLILMISDVKSRETEQQVAKVELSINSQNQKTSL